ncbi:hypothetical protein ACLKA7_000955 [Drosophila subpalustris]
MSLKILQINLHHCKAASAALLLRLAGDGADVVLIQEPWIVGGKVSGLRTQEYKLIVADSQELISSSQHAYRKGRSTETALHSVIVTIEKSLSLKEYTLIAFLDIEGAFNNVFPEAITGALLDLGIESRLVGLISQLLKCRAVTSSLGSSTLTSREDWTLEPPGQPDALSFYTDGSKLNNKVGGGVHSPILDDRDQPIFDSGTVPHSYNPVGPTNYVCYSNSIDGCGYPHCGRCADGHS